MGSLVKRNVSTGGGESLIIINGHVDVLDKFDRAYLLYTRECVDQACKQFKVSEFSIYFEHPVEGEVESKSGPDEAEARCKETRTATTTLLCVKPDEFTVDVKGKGSYIVSPEAYGRVVPGQQASFSGFGPIHWTPVF